MNPAIIGFNPAVLAAILAATAKRNREMEEEQMTEYPADNVKDEWEYKILRANRSIFKNPNVFHGVCAEEKRAGWVLVEKFDNMRLRFKRPMSARENDHTLPFDPYRTCYGMGPGALAALILLSVFGSIALVIMALIIFSNHH